MLFSQADSSGIRHIDPTTKEIKYNPKVEELFAPLVSALCSSVIWYLILIHVCFFLLIIF